MARLPDIEDLGARPVPESRRQIATVRNAGAVGGALAEVGRTGSAVIERLEQINDEDDVRRLDIEHAQRAREIRQRAQQARGANAAEARQTAEQELDALNAEFTERARSRTARDALGQLVARRSLIERDSIAEHAMREDTASRDAAMTARVETSVQQAEEHWENPEAVESSINTAVTEIGNRGQWRGETPEQVESAQRAARSRVRASIVEQRIAADDYAGAQAYLDAHREEIDHEREIRLRAIINGELNLQVADSDAAAVLGGLPQPEETPPGEQTWSSPVRAETTTVPGGRYGAPRDYGSHRAVDLAGVPEGTNLYPMAHGTVTDFGQTGGGGVYVTINYGGGYTSTYRHMQAGSTAGLRRNQEVGPNDVVGRLGNTGSRSSGAHAHVEVNGPNGRVDPTTMFGEAAPRTAPPDGTRIDLEEAYRRIDEMPWTEARRRRARERVRQVAGENDLIRARTREDAEERISQRLVEIAQSGQRLTNINQLPADALASAGPDFVGRVYATIEANNRAETAEPNSPLMASLVVQAGTDPNRFLREVDPELYRGRVTDAEVEQLHRMRLDIQNRTGPQPSEILGTIRWVIGETTLVPPVDVRLEGDARQRAVQAQDALQRNIEGRLMSAVQARLARQFPQGSQINEQDILNAVRAETTAVTVNGQQMYLFQTREAGIQRGRVNIPRAAVPLIDEVLRRAGLPITPENRFQTYLRNRSEFDGLR